MRAESKPLKAFIGNVTKSAKSYSPDKGSVNKLIGNGVPKKKAEMLMKMIEKRLYINDQVEKMKFKLERIEHLSSSRQITRSQISKKCR
jgi:hypothetical protein